MGAIQAVRQRTYRALDELSPEGLEERARFLEFLGFRNRAENPGGCAGRAKESVFHCGGEAAAMKNKLLFGAAEAAGGPMRRAVGEKPKLREEAGGGVKQQPALRQKLCSFLVNGAGSVNKLYRKSDANKHGRARISSFRYLRSLLAQCYFR